MGIIRLAASALIDLNNLITTNTAIIHRLTTANAQPRRCMPKNTHDQAIPSSNCRPQLAKATLASPLLVSHTNQAATAINTYKTAHTEAMISADGVHEGLERP